MSRRFSLALTLLTSLAWFGCAETPEQSAAPPTAEAPTEAAQRTVKATVQMRPGGPVEEVEMGVHEAPVDPPRIAADEATLDDAELVIGLVVDGVPVAYPVRYLATTEVMNDRVGDTSLSPTW